MHAVSVPITHIPPNIAVGDTVDVWAAVAPVDGSYTEPSVPVARDAIVIATGSPDSYDAKSVTLGVFVNDIAYVVAAITTGPVVLAVHPSGLTNN
jgi:hypothetical protein